MKNYLDKEVEKLKAHISSIQPVAGTPENEFDYWRREALEAQVKISVMAEALQWAYEMLKARDEMNAKVHCSPVRLSPITIRCEQALKQIGETK